MSGNAAVWNTTYPSTVPSGNRYVFSLQPTVAVAADAQSRVYDATATAPALSSVVTGLVDASLYGNVFTQDVLSGGLAVAAPGKNVGSYAIVQGTLAAPAGYALNYTGNKFDITPASLTITAKDQSKNEAATFTFAGSEFMTTGLVGGEQIAGVTLTSAGASASAPAGSYSIKPVAVVAGAGFLTSNYAISYTDGTMSVIAVPGCASTGTSTSIGTRARACCCRRS